jgi:hypothetical protein
MSSFRPCPTVLTMALGITVPLSLLRRTDEVIEPPQEDGIAALH